MMFRLVCMVGRQCDPMCGMYTTRVAIASRKKPALTSGAGHTERKDTRNTRQEDWRAVKNYYLGKVPSTSSNIVFFRLRICLRNGFIFPLPISGSFRTAPLRRRFNSSELLRMTLPLTVFTSMRFGGGRNR